MDGLIIKSPYIEMILEGKKTWEIRGNKTTKRGKIALIKSGSKTVVGYCHLVDVVGPLTVAEYCSAEKLHRGDCRDARRYGLYYNKTYAWVLTDIKKLKKPIPYTHPNGAVIWVKLKK
jgi:hypothetical protein